jgi:hypothetical protein
MLTLTRDKPDEPSGFQVLLTNKLLLIVDGLCKA